MELTRRVRQIVDAGTPGSSPGAGKPGHDETSVGAKRLENKNALPDDREGALLGSAVGFYQFCAVEPVTISSAGATTASVAASAPQSRLRDWRCAPSSASVCPGFRLTRTRAEA